VEITCPNCGKPITLIGTKVIASEYGIGPNTLNAAQKKGEFPDPVLNLGNRLLWLEQDIQKYKDSLTSKQIDRDAERLLKRMGGDPASAKEVLARMMEKVAETQK
jgi:predicted DNA-binding transcriptional regulator AlpA